LAARASDRWTASSIIRGVADVGGFAPAAGVAVVRLPAVHVVHGVGTSPRAGVVVVVVVVAGMVSITVCAEADEMAPVRATAATALTIASFMGLFTWFMSFS